MRTAGRLEDAGEMWILREEAPRMVLSQELPWSLRFTGADWPLPTRSECIPAKSTFSAGSKAAVLTGCGLSRRRRGTAIEGCVVLAGDRSGDISHRSGTK